MFEKLDVRPAGRSHCGAENLLQHDFMDMMSTCEMENISTKLLFHQSTGSVNSSCVIGCSILLSKLRALILSVIPHSHSVAIIASAMAFPFD
jgi:hypothetical protein